MDIHNKIEITEKEFDLIKELTCNKLGISLPEHKKSMVIGRMQKVLRIKGLTSFKAYYDYLTTDNTGQALIEFINQITTNHTYFYREKEHFNYFVKTLLPELTQRLKNLNNMDIRIWSAGCSSGEEPYMLAIYLMEFLGFEYSQWQASILATDISDKVLNIAKIGIYPPERLELLPVDIKYKYFKKLKDKSWAIKDHVKKEVVFRRFNLMNEGFPFKNKFHIIFCKNVMIYFDKPTKDALVQRFYNKIEPEGYFFIGMTESLGRATAFKYLQPAIYQKC